MGLETNQLDPFGYIKYKSSPLMHTILLPLQAVYSTKHNSFEVDIDKDEINISRLEINTLDQILEGAQN